MSDPDCSDLHAWTFLWHHIVNRVGPEHYTQIRTRVLQRTAQPQNCVVLFFQRSAISCFDDIQNFHDNLPRYLVGITRVLVDSLAILKKSAGLPRLTPSTTFAAPRSSTHNPQFTHVSSGLSLPIDSSELTNAFVVGCSSS